MSRSARRGALVLLSLPLLLAFPLSCTGGGGFGCFRVSGKVANLGAKGSKATVTADYVYAVNTCSGVFFAGEEWRKRAPLEPDGSFEITLSKGDAWVLAFIDSSRVGTDMIQGIFGAQELDSIAPTMYDSDDSTDVGDVVVDPSGDAPIAPENYETFVGNLGMDLAGADTLGSLDDLMLRQINPDIDANGILDMDDRDMPEMESIIYQGYRYGDSSLITDIRSGVELPPDAAMAFQGAGPSLIYKKTRSGIYSAIPPKWSLQWTNPGDYGGTNPAVWTASSPGADGTGAQDVGYAFSLDVGFPPTTIDVPDGTYIYRLYSSESDPDDNPEVTLTFTHVKTMDDATDTTNFVRPFPVFDVDGNGDVTSISYKWMRKEAAGFVPATSADVEMILGKNIPQIVWWTGEASAEMCWYPCEEGFHPTGTLSISRAREIEPGFSLKRADIDGVGMYFSTKLGLRMTLAISAE